MARARLVHGDFEGALVAHRHAVELSGSRPVNYQLLVTQKPVILRGLGDVAASEAAAREALGYHGTVWMRLHLIAALAEQDKLEEAQAALEVYQLDPLAHTLSELAIDYREIYNDKLFVDGLVGNLREAGLE